MKYSQARQMNKHQNSDTCIVYAHQLNDKDFDCAIAEITGRYPDSGYVVNKVCKEMALVQEGSGTITIEGQTTQLTTGDCVVIEAGERFFWDGKMTLVLSCKPGWYAEQHIECQSVAVQY